MRTRTDHIGRCRGIAALGLLLVSGAAFAATGDGLEALGPRFALDLDAYRKTDPASVRYRETGAIRIDAEEVHGVAVGPDDAIYATGDQSLFVFESGGRKRSASVLPAAATCLAVGPDGTVYLGHRDRVAVLRPGAPEPEPWTDLGEKAVVTGIAVDGRNVLLADAGNRIVMRFDPSGRLLKLIGRKNKAKGIPGFIIPSPYFDVLLGADETLWVVNPGRLSVEQYTLDGALRGSWGKASMAIEGFCGCCNPSHLARTPDGTFVTSEKGLPRVKTYDAEGTFSGVVAGAELFGEEDTGLDLAVDSRGRILVLHPGQRTLRVFERIHAAEPAARQ